MVWTRLWCERKKTIRDECSAKNQLVWNWNSGVDTFGRWNWQINKKDKKRKQRLLQNPSTSTGFLTSCSQRPLSLEGCESLRRLVNNDKDPRRKFCLLFSLLGTLSWDSRYAEPLDGDWWSVGQVCHLDIRGMTLGPASLTIGTCTSPPRLKPLLYNIASKILEIYLF